MKDNKLTPEEIKKALECCISPECDNCPYDGDDLLRPCNQNLMKDALDLINRQQAEIENADFTIEQLTKGNLQLQAEIDRLRHEREVLIEDIHHSADQINEQFEEIERLQNDLAISKKETKRCATRRAEATKEFAKDIHEEIRKALDNNYKVRNQRIERNLTEKRAETCDDVVHYVEGKIDALRGIDGFVCDYVKEMVGEK